MIAHLQGLALAVLAFVVSAGVFVLSGTLDTRRGYDTSWRHVCTAAGLAALASALAIFWYLLPLLSVLVVLAAAVGAVMLAVGTLWVIAR